MTQLNRARRASRQTSLRFQIQYLADPDIASYITSLKKKYQKYALPADEARKVIDKSMGSKTLTELLYEARGQVD